MLFMPKQQLYFPWKYTKLVNCYKSVIILRSFKFFLTIQVSLCPVGWWLWISHKPYVILAYTQHTTNCVHLWQLFINHDVNWLSSQLVNAATYFDFHVTHLELWTIICIACIWSRSKANSYHRICIVGFGKMAPVLSGRWIQTFRWHMLLRYSWMNVCIFWTSYLQAEKVIQLLERDE
jgi:hypothetical protein